jgi:hypothetical protein
MPSSRSSRHGLGVSPTVRIRLPAVPQRRSRVALSGVGSPSSAGRSGSRLEYRRTSRTAGGSAHGSTSRASTGTVSRRSSSTPTGLPLPDGSLQTSAQGSEVGRPRNLGALHASTIGCAPTPVRTTSASDDLSRCGSALPLSRDGSSLALSGRGAPTRKQGSGRCPSGSAGAVEWWPSPSCWRAAGRPADRRQPQRPRPPTFAVKESGGLPLSHRGESSHPKLSARRSSSIGSLGRSSVGPGRPRFVVPPLTSWTAARAFTRPPRGGGSAGGSSCAPRRARTTSGGWTTCSASCATR